VSLRAGVMLSSLGRLSSRNLGRPIQGCIFFILFFLFVYLWIDPKLIYHGHGQSVIYPICTSEVSAFEDYPAFPGKAAMYMAARLPYYYYYSWAGALIITGIAGLLCIGTDKFIATVGGGRLRWLRFVPAIFLLAQHGRYYPFLLAENLALLIALFFLYFYIRMPLHSAGSRLVMFMVFSAVMYATAVQLYLVFVLMCVSVEFFNKRRVNTGLLCLFSGLLIPYLVNTFVFELNVFEAYGLILSFPSQLGLKSGILVFSFFSFFPMVGFGCGLRQLFAEKRKSGRGKSSRRKPVRHKSVRGKSSRKRKSLEYRHKSKLIWALEMLTLLIVTAGAVWLTCDHTARQNQRIDYFARHKMWDELLQQARFLRDYDMFICHDVNRALYHTGRLLYDMFLYPQHYSGLLLTPGRHLPDYLMIQMWVKSSNTLFELGHINDAENASYEALSSLGYYPEGLQRLALINIIKGQTDAARTFLHALSKDFWYKDLAKQYLQRLETDPLLTKDDQIQRIRSFMLVEDSINKTTPLDLLEKNKDNQMAFEYLMAFCLLTGQHATVAHNVGYLDNFDYPKGQIPRHLAEAILLYTAMTGKKPDLHGRRINAETIRRFQQFMQRFQRHKYNMQTAAQILEREFGDTYYYFYFFLLDKSELKV